MTWWNVLTVFKIVLMMGFWFLIWTREPRPLWPFGVIVAAWIPTFVNQDLWSGPVNLGIGLVFLWALTFFEDDRWKRLKRKLKSGASRMTEVARAAFARQVREAA